MQADVFYENPHSERLVRKLQAAAQAVEVALRFCRAVELCYASGEEAEALTFRKWISSLGSRTPADLPIKLRFGDAPRRLTPPAKLVDSIRELGQHTLTWFR